MAKLRQVPDVQVRLSQKKRIKLYWNFWKILDVMRFLLLLLIALKLFNMY